MNTERLFDELAAEWRHHSRDDFWWKTTNSVLDQQRNVLENALREGGVELGPLGYVSFPFTKMGNITSVDLFGLDELILFAFYWSNRYRYRYVVDLGANIGLHSVVLALCGFEVSAFEPDPNHVVLLRQNLVSAGVQKRVTVHEAAVAPFPGNLEFIRVLGNTTGSHVAGAKPSPYGNLERFEVTAVGIREVTGYAQLVKMDVEGLESDLLSALTPDDLAHLDIICEVGSVDNAAKIWDLFRDSNSNLFSQKIGWEKVHSVEDIPTSHREGSLFVSTLDTMPWDEMDMSK